MSDNLKLNIELTVDGESRQVDIDKVAVTAEKAGEGERLVADKMATIQKDQLEEKIKDLNKALNDKQALVVEAQTGTQAELAKLVAMGQLQATELAQQTALLKRVAARSRPPSVERFRSAGAGWFASALQEALGAAVSDGAQRLRGVGALQRRLGPEALPLLESGATVLALAQGAGGAPQQVQVVVENRGATQQEVVEQRAVMDGGRLVVNVALDDIMRRGPLSQALEQTYALGRRTG